MPEVDLQVLDHMSGYLAALGDAEGFSGVTLVVSNGETLFEKALGLANVESKTPITCAAIFRIGSLTKAITATAVFQLSDEGLLSIDDRICEYVSHCPPEWSAITIHQLLTHTSGIPSFTALSDYQSFMGFPTTPWATLARVKNLPLEFRPGDKFRYSNSGYVLLGLALEKVSGAPYGELLRNRIFDPLKMHHTGYGLPPNAAQGYKLEDDRLHRASFIDVSVPYAAGGLFSTVQDLRRFVSSLFEGRLISKSSLAAMLTPIYERQASGWIVDEFHGREMIWHSGGINGHSSHIAYLPDQRLAVIVLSNRETGTADKAARDLTSIVLDEPYVFPICGEPFEIEPNILSAYVGDYEIKPGIVATITALDRSLYVQIGGQEKFRAYAISATRFMVREVNAELRFEREPNGECGLIVRQYYKMFVAQRVK